MSEIPCPACGLPAQVELRFALASTDGPVEHLRTRCPAGHVLTVLAEWLRPESALP